MVRARMDELSVRPVDLAKLVGTSTAQISLLFSTAKSSAMVPRIHRVLRLPPPKVAGVTSEADELKAEIDENWSLLTDDERALVLQVVRVATRRRTSR